MWGRLFYHNRMQFNNLQYNCANSSGLRHSNAAGAHISNPIPASVFPVRAAEGSKGTQGQTSQSPVSFIAEVASLAVEGRGYCWQQPLGSGSQPASK